MQRETNLKRRTALNELCNITTPESVSTLKGRIECEKPNENLHKFTGRLIFTTPDAPEEVSKSLNMDHLILRGAVLRNTDFAYAIVVYTGADTKIIKNLKPAKAKTSTLERQLNYFVGGAFVFNAFLLISSVVISYAGFIQELNQQKERQKTNPYDYAVTWYIGPVQDSAATVSYLYLLCNFLMAVTGTQKLHTELFCSLLLCHPHITLCYDGSCSIDSGPRHDMGQENGKQAHQR
jgi:hypothetical protein